MAIPDRAARQSEGRYASVRTELLAGGGLPRTHTMRTLVIDRQGRLAADFEGNQFTARQLGDYVEVLMAGK